MLKLGDKRLLQQKRPVRFLAKGFRLKSSAHLTFLQTRGTKVLVQISRAILSSLAVLNPRIDAGRNPHLKPKNEEPVRQSRLTQNAKFKS